MHLVNGVNTIQSITIEFNTSLFIYVYEKYVREAPKYCILGVDECKMAWYYSIRLQDKSYE